MIKYEDNLGYRLASDELRKTALEQIPNSTNEVKIEEITNNMELFSDSINLEHNINGVYN